MRLSSSWLHSFLANALALILVCSLDANAMPSSVGQLKLAHVATFVSFMGDVGIEPGKVVVFNNIQSWSQTAEESKKDHPQWNGEDFQAELFTWNPEKKKYEYRNEFFGPTANPIWKTPGLGNPANNLFGLDKVNLRIAKLPWASLVPKNARAEAYVLADVDGDGVKEVVLLTREVEVKEHKLPATISIIKPSAGGYKVIASTVLNRWSKDEHPMLLQVRDVNKDHLPEILLWSSSLGGSGYSIALDIYAMDVGQHYLEAY